MAYATTSDLIERFGEAELIKLTDRVQPYSQAIVQSVVDQALADADAEIDGYLAARYTLPLAQVPPLLKRLACDLARLFLHDDRPTDAVKDNAAQARKTLTDIAKGTVALPDQTGAATPSGDTARVAGPADIGSGRVFTLDQLRSM